MQSGKSEDFASAKLGRDVGDDVLLERSGRDKFSNRPRCNVSNAAGPVLACQGVAGGAGANQRSI
jgi:hypothetical protein